jgi:polyisoprenoid-binding protein YceI
MNYLVLVLASSLLFSTHINAALPTWKIESSTSALTFTATQNNAPVKGKFTNFSGNIVFDPNNLSQSNVNISIDMDSVSMPFSQIADTLKTTDWFNATLFPHAVFTSDKINKSNDGFQAVGKLTIRDKSQPATINFQLQENSPNKIIAVGNTIFKRTQFGVGQGEWASTDDIKDEVKIDFTLHLNKIN